MCVFECQSSRKRVLFIQSINYSNPKSSYIPVQIEIFFFILQEMATKNKNKNKIKMGQITLGIGVQQNALL